MPLRPKQEPGPAEISWTRQSCLDRIDFQEQHFIEETSETKPLGLLVAPHRSLNFMSLSAKDVEAGPTQLY